MATPTTAALEGLAAENRAVGDLTTLADTTIMDVIRDGMATAPEEN